MSEQPSPRPRFQFRLRTLMIGVTLFAVPLDYVTHEARIAGERKAALDHGYELRYSFTLLDDTANRTPWLRRLFGDLTVHIIWVPPEPDPTDLERFHALFPEAQFRY